MIPRDHDHLNPSRAALLDGVRDGGSRRINHGHEAEEPQLCHLWPAVLLVLGIKGEALGKHLRVEFHFAEAEDALAKSAQLRVGPLEPLLHGLIQRERSLTVFGEDGGAAVDDPLRGSFHGQEVIRILSGEGVDRDLQGI